MSNYKINRNKPDLTDEQIARHKDFSKVLSDHQKVLKYKEATKPLYKNPRFMGLMVMLSVVLLVYFISDKETEETNTKKNEIQNNKGSVETPNTEKENVTPADSLVEKDTQTVKTVSAAMPEVSLPTIGFKQFIVDPAKGATIYSGSTRILIPVFAFRDKNGKPVTDEVTIRYRELNDPVSIYLSGIPMHYDSTGANQLVSAGMFEIRGRTAQGEVFIKEPVTVELASPSHKNYNAYYLNEEKQKWEYVKADQKSLRFIIASNNKDFPELVPLKDVVWEFVAKNPEDYGHIFSKSWSKFFLDEKLAAGANNARIKHNASEPKFVVRPVALMGNKELNEKIIEAKYKEYYERVKKKDQDEKLLAELRQKQDEWLKSKEGQEFIRWANTGDGQKQILSSRIVSVFSINKFGVWNCGQSGKLPQGASIKPKFQAAGDNKYFVSDFFLVDYSINSVYKYAGSEIRFNPKSKNVLWAPAYNGKIAVVTSENFKTIPTQGSPTITVEFFDIKEKTEADVKHILGMENHVTSKQELKDKDPVGTYERVLNIKKENRQEVFYQQENDKITSDIAIKPTEPGAKKTTEDAANKLKGKLPFGDK